MADLTVFPIPQIPNGYNKLGKKLMIHDLTEPEATSTKLIPFEKVLTTEVTYADFYTMITTSQLVVGMTYIIMDFQTVYDQMDFDVGGSLKPTLVTKTGATEQIWVLALSSNQIADKAYSATFPNDEIQYDWTYNTTFVNGSPAKGRISERIDEWNNRTDYDHREIKFIRYDNGSGVFNIINDNGNASNEFLTFGNTYATNTGEIIYDNYLGDFYSIGQFFGQEYSNNVFSGGSAVSNKSESIFYNNTFGEQTNNNTFNGQVNTNTFSGQINNNTFSGQVNTNTFSGRVQNNTFSGDINNNKFNGQVGSNTFSVDLITNIFNGDVVNNIFSGDVVNNIFSEDVYNNTFSGGVYSNTFSGYVQNNTFSGNIEYNTFSGGVNNNTFSGYVDYNTFSGDVQNNTFNGRVRNNTFSGGVYYNTFSGDVQNNTFSGQINNNTFSGQVNNNTFSGGVQSNTFNGDVQNNTFSGDINNNTFSGDINNNTFSGGVNNNTFSGRVRNNTFTHTTSLQFCTIASSLNNKTIDDVTYPILFGNDFKKEIIKGSDNNDYIKTFDGTIDKYILIP